MSAPICVECEQPRDYGATLLHVCHCDETAGDLRVLIHLRDTEVTRLRAALARIEALQPVHPTMQVYETDTGLARAFGRWEASAIAHVTLDDQYDADGKARAELVAK